MNQADLEKYTFLYFCGKKDRDILLGKRKMTLEDLERFSYLTDLLGFQKYHAQIWNTFSGELEEKFEALEHLYEERSPQTFSFSEDFGQQDNWKDVFLKNISDSQARRQLAEIFENN